MSGDDRDRLCGQCNLHVHNLSDMPDRRSDSSMAPRPLCVRFFAVKTARCSRAIAPPASGGAVKSPACRPSTVAIVRSVAVESFGQLAQRGRRSEAEDRYPLADGDQGDVCFTPAPVAADRRNALDDAPTAREREQSGGMPDVLDPDVIPKAANR